MHAQPQETPRHHKPAMLQRERSSTTFAQRQHMSWRPQTLVRNTAGQEGAPKPRTARQTLKRTLPCLIQHYKRAIRNYNVNYI